MGLVQAMRGKLFISYSNGMRKVAIEGKGHTKTYAREQQANTDAQDANAHVITQRTPRQKRIRHQ